MSVRRGVGLDRPPRRRVARRPTTTPNLGDHVGDDIRQRRREPPAVLAARLGLAPPDGWVLAAPGARPRRWSTPTPTGAADRSRAARGRRRGDTPAGAAARRAHRRLRADRARVRRRGRGRARRAGRACSAGVVEAAVARAARGRARPGARGARPVHPPGALRVRRGRPRSRWSPRSGPRSPARTDDGRARARPPGRGAGRARARPASTSSPTSTCAPSPRPDHFSHRRDGATGRQALVVGARSVSADARRRSPTTSPRCAPRIAAAAAPGRARSRRRAARRRDQDGAGRAHRGRRSPPGSPTSGRTGPRSCSRRRPRSADEPRAAALALHRARSSATRCGRSRRGSACWHSVDRRGARGRRSPGTLPGRTSSSR